MSHDRYPPLPPLSPQDRAYAEIVVTQPWQPVPQIQTQEANAARIVALEAEIARLRTGIADEITYSGMRPDIARRLRGLLAGDVCTG